MGIGRAEKRGNLVFVHDEEGQLRFVRIGEPYAQTRSTISIERTGLITIFDETGREIADARLVGDDLAPVRSRMLRAARGR